MCFKVMKTLLTSVQKKKKTFFFRKTPIDLTIGGSYPMVTPGEPCVVGKREHVVRKRRLL